MTEKSGNTLTTVSHAWSEELDKLELARHATAYQYIVVDSHARRVAGLLGSQVTGYGDFVDATQGLTSPFVMRGVAGDIYNWNRFNRELATYVPRGDAHSVSRAGTPLSEETYIESATATGQGTIRTWIPGAVHKAASDGYTVALASVDRMSEAIREVAADLEYVFEKPVYAATFASFDSNPGFNTHWDPGDMVVLQSEGSKEWAIFEPGTAMPQEGTQPTWHGVLSRGDVLYLPRKWWHTVSCTDQPSLHLSFSIAGAYEGLNGGSSNELQRLLVRALARPRAAFSLQVAGHLSKEVSKYDHVRSNIPRPTPYRRFRDRLVIAAGGRFYKFPAPVGEIALCLLSSDGRPLEEVCVGEGNVWDDSAISIGKVVKALVSNDLIRIEEEELR